MIVHSLADRTSTTAVASDNMPDGDFRITDLASSSPSQLTELAQALEKASVSLTDILALLGKDHPHRTLHNKADELFASLGVKDLT